MSTPADAESQPWFHLIARVRPHDPGRATLTPHYPRDLVAAMHGLLGPLDLDGIFLLPEQPDGTTSYQRRWYDAGDGAGPVEIAPLVEHPSERHAWVRRTSYSGAALEKRGFVTDDSGQVLVDEAVLGQLLLDAGWERTA